ncbi:MAG: hypothetical protein ABS81_05955 [Pseudonocardia sp. SCN 72-86]|nr:MAG: hypothetical protein ABS81_05955 [Pseudonocardia sp. SCN 72-86]
MSHAPCPDDERARFRSVLGHYPTGVAVITALTPTGEPVGMTVGTFSSVSLQPALVSFLADHTSTSLPRIGSAASFCVNVLAEDQQDMGRTFAARGDDKFAGLGWSTTATGSPRLDGVAAWVDCTIEYVHTTGDHLLVLGRVVDLRADPQRRPLLFLRGGFGHFRPAA